MKVRFTVILNMMNYGLYFMYKLTIFGVSLAELQHIDHKVYYIQHGSKDYRIKPYFNYHVIYFNFKLNSAFLSHKEVILKQREKDIFIFLVRLSRFNEFSYIIFCEKKYDHEALNFLLYSSYNYVT